MTNSQLVRLEEPVLRISNMVEALGGIINDRMKVIDDEIKTYQHSRHSIRYLMVRLRCSFSWLFSKSASWERHLRVTIRGHQARHG
jgi:hypothetical protein